MIVRHTTRLLVAVAFAVSGSLVFAGQKPDDADSYVRLRRSQQEEPIALETAIARFVPTDEGRRGLVVDLIGAIHIADKDYYAKLNRRFRGYDAVLYELVAREDANVPQPGQGTGSAIGGMQVGMKSLLELDYQLDCIDYSRKNMVHADMSPEEFSETMKRRKETWLGTFFRIMGRSFAEQAKDPVGKSDWQVLAAFFAEDRAYRLKLALAEQFTELEDQMSMFDGPEGSTIVTERNKKALDVLQRELDRGRKRVAIFYGAGHLMDLQRRLEKDFGMKRVKTEWLPAWSLVRKESSKRE